MGEITCDRCKEYTDTNAMKYSKDGKKLLCIKCYTELYEGQINVEKKQEDNPLSQHYICRKCRYKFKFKKDSYTKVNCPYCRSEDIEPINKLDADFLIGEAAKSEYDL